MEFLQLHWLTLAVWAFLLAFIAIASWHKIKERIANGQNQSFHAGYDAAWKEIGPELTELRVINIRLKNDNETLGDVIGRLARAGKIPVIELRQYPDKRREPELLEANG